MHDWNAVITVRPGGFAPVCRLLEPFGPVKKTEFFNTLVMRTPDPFQVLADLQARCTGDPDIAAGISRFMPVERLFAYRSPAEFELRSRETVREWLPRLAGANFHVRMHRRGFRGRLSSAEEERFLDQFLLDRLSQAGTPGRITFDAPDAIIAVETIGPQAGLALLDREQLRRFPLLHLD